MDPNPDPRREKMTNKSRKKVNKFNLFKYWMFYFEGSEGFSCRPRDK
jgi:hypothetical protein